MWHLSNTRLLSDSEITLADSQEKTHTMLKQLQVLLLLYLAIPSQALAGSCSSSQLLNFGSVWVSGWDLLSLTHSSLTSYIRKCISQALTTTWIPLSFISRLWILSTCIRNRHLETSYSLNTALEVLHPNLVIFLSVLSLWLLQPSKKPWSHPWISSTENLIPNMSRESYWLCHQKTVCHFSLSTPLSGSPHYHLFSQSIPMFT